MRLPQNAQYVVSSAKKKSTKKLCAGETDTPTRKQDEKNKNCAQIPSRNGSDLDLNYIHSYARSHAHTYRERVVRTCAHSRAHGLISFFLWFCYVHLLCSDCLFRFLFSEYTRKCGGFKSF